MELWLTRKQTILWTAVTIGSYHVAYELPQLGIVIIGYLVGLFMLARVANIRAAFWLGLGIGMLTLAPQLEFLWRIFKVSAVPLWMILALFTALFLATARACLERFPRFGMLAIPILWTGLEYFRSELYYLRFSWGTPSLALGNSGWVELLTLGTYGFSLVVLVCCCLASKHLHLNRYLRYVLVAGISVVILAHLLPTCTPLGDAVQVTGVQYEFAYESTLMKAIEKAHAQHPDTQIMVLSEYAFQGEVPEEFKAWCRAHGCYLIAGGKEPVSPNVDAWYNTAYVISPDGEVVHKQVKSVPIQFFDDGEPATSQDVWQSPWGPIGIAICYDLSYTRVIDGLVQKGARALIIPTMDVEEWGERQHKLHGRVAPARAREYDMEIFRLCSSGISQLVSHRGIVMAEGGFPGQGDIISGRLRVSKWSRRVPWDHRLAPLCSAGVGMLWLILGITIYRHRRQLAAEPKDEKSSAGGGA